jgi:hypothetical protein
VTAADCVGEDATSSRASATLPTPVEASSNPPRLESIPTPGASSSAGLVVDRTVIYGPMEPTAASSTAYSLPPMPEAGAASHVPMKFAGQLQPDQDRDQIGPPTFPRSSAPAARGVDARHTIVENRLRQVCIVKGSKRARGRRAPCSCLRNGVCLRTCRLSCC